MKTPSYLSPQLPANKSLPEKVSSYYAALAVDRVLDRDPIAAQYVFRAQEDIVLPYECRDPLAESRYMPVPRLIHRYPNRVLLLVCDRCATYCRYCFRRHFTGKGAGSMTASELAQAGEYIRSNMGITEILLSGGDPLMLSDAQLADVLVAMQKAGAGRDLVLRLATRVPVVLPERVSESLVRMLRERGQGRLWCVIHMNHPREITPAFAAAIRQFVDHGIPVLNQSVLLRGVNNDVDTLAELCTGLLRLRVKPYYLFQGDLAAGTSHFRTTIDEGLAIMAALRDRVSGMAMPTYAVDMPDGGGKIELTRASVLGVEAGHYILLDRDGKRHRYPQESY